MIRVLIAAASLSVTATSAVAQQETYIRPGEPWMDDRGQHIQAHGGGIIQHNGIYYWFGEDRAPGNDPAKRYVAGYSSKDLINWHYLGQVFQFEQQDGLTKNFVLERPKVFHNVKTGKFVLYAHLDDDDAQGRPYKLAQLVVAVSDKIDGPFKFVRRFRPLGQESRDIGQFVDDDGTPYLIFEARPTKGFFIASLSSDYLDVVKQVAFIQAPIEGGAIVKYDDLYYVLGSKLTGWSPNPNLFATAKSLSGPWSPFKDIAPPELNTYRSQSTNLIKVVGSNKTTVVYVGDRWFPKQLAMSTHVWMPLEIGGGSMWLPKPQPWTIDVKTGVTSIEK